MLAASFEAEDQLKAYPEALKRAAAISAKVYNEQNGDYWLKYYQGTREQDKTGNMVELGGSAVNNLNDNLLLFGLQPGANNNFRSTYTVFGNIATQQYPALFKDANKIPDVKEALPVSNSMLQSRFETTVPVSPLELKLATSASAPVCESIEEAPRT